MFAKYCFLSALELSYRALSLSNIYAINMWLLLSPSSLCCDWSLGSVPLVTSLADSANVWSLLLYVSLMALVLHTMRSKRDRILVGTGVMLLILPFLPATGLVFRVGFVVAERWVDTKNCLLHVEYNLLALVSIA